MRQAYGIVLGSGFSPPTGKPRFSHNPNVGFPYGWNWTSGSSVESKIVGPSYSGFAHSLGGFSPFGGIPMGGSGGPFQPTPMGAGPNPQMQGGSNVPFQHPPLRPGEMPTPSNQVVHMVPMGNLYQMGGHTSYPSSYPYPPN